MKDKIVSVVKSPLTRQAAITATLIVVAVVLTKKQNSEDKTDK